MRVHRLELQDYRGIRELSLDFDPRVNVIVGENGAGKSAVLDALAVMLSRLVSRYTTSTATGRFFSQSDVSNGRPVLTASVTATFQGAPLQWTVARTGRGKTSQTISNLSQIKDVAARVLARLNEEAAVDLPLAIFYPTNRAVLDIPLRIRKKHPFVQLEAYDDALTGARNDFRIFFEWFRNREDLENELRVQKKNHRDRDLNAVRSAIESLLPNLGSLRVRRSPLRMTLVKGKTELQVDQLSDGEKCLLALAGDLARRLAMANPTLANPLEGSGIVLVDEIDLHLHPAWQRIVVQALGRTFPNCQWIVSTHSPHVLNHMAKESVFILRRQNGDVDLRHPERAYGADINAISEDIQGTRARSDDVVRDLDALFREIDKRNLDKAKQNLSALREKIGDDPELVRASAILRRIEAIGK